MKKNSIAVLLLVYVLFSVAFTFIPASADADDDANFLQFLLDQSSDQVNDKISELEDAGITIPFSVDSFYSQGLAGYESALASIEEGNLDEAQEHAFEAMSLFEDALEGLFETEEDFGDQVDGNTDEINELVDTISNSEIDADEIRDLAIQNDLDISFGDYDDAIEDAKVLLAGGDLEGATQQFENAEDLLEDAFDQIDEGIDLQQDDRVDEFVTSTILQLEGIIEGANELGIAQSFIDELQNTLDILQTAESTDKIIDATDQSSDLNDVITEFPELVQTEDAPGDALGDASGDALGDASGDAPGDVDNETEIKIKIEEGDAKVKVEFDGQKIEFSLLDTTDRDEIITEIVARTGLTIEEIEEGIMKFEEKDEDDFIDDFVDGFIFEDQVHENFEDDVDEDIKKALSEDIKALEKEEKEAAKFAEEAAKGAGKASEEEAKAAGKAAEEAAKAAEKAAKGD